MAFGRSALGSSGTSGGGRATGAGGQRPLSDINVTPLVDVMLVLLVIFIITAPLLASSIRLDLPQTDAGQPNEVPRFVSLVVDAKGIVYLNDQPVDNTQLAERLKQAATDNRETEVQLRADQTVPYGKVVELMGIANKAGLSRIGFVTEPPSAR
ncbi:biopolymer transporter ExbD [Variovorax sp. J22G21]|uniref:ExbD/TolR family protein n=1 Tax=Variovorax fucosicus TaxID=3053517 RepID=UPI0025786C75|nr:MULTISPECIES: biopolymer transporter ExbD [unclassified Variovorax]MDM0039600.1 biopolymer transporter ExbD [Variovorax sp. J22R193]MDM0054788.1 biopolymer transporter ExbD [Variovorax sp. J22G47]MDM0064375.1 biopolymer transporter ExbD [Variovorax sp. J22G21]